MQKREVSFQKDGLDLSFLHDVVSNLSFCIVFEGEKGIFY